MALVFLESGTDATQDLSFYSLVVGAISSSTTDPHTGPRCIEIDGVAGAQGYVRTDNVLGEPLRVTMYIKFSAFPTATLEIMRFRSVTVANASLRITLGGVLQAFDSGGSQTGSNGSTLSLSTWHRISLIWNPAGATGSRYRIYVNGTLDISDSAGGTFTAGVNNMILGWIVSPGSGNRKIYFDNIVCDTGVVSADIGDLRVTAKLPVALNTNNFDTLIGSATNRWDYVAERPLSISNGIQHAAATDVQENFGLESAGDGDVNISYATIVGRAAWVFAKKDFVSVVAHRASIASGSTNPTTTFTITIPATVATDDDCYVTVTSRDHTVGTAYPTCVDTDSGGNAWAKIGESTDRVLTLWWKKATAATASKVITVAGCVGSSSGGVACYRNAAAGNPTTNIVVQDNSSGVETHASIVPDTPGSMFCFAVANYGNDNAVTSVSGAESGAFTSRFEKLSTGGSDCANTQWGVLGVGWSPSGAITWAQTDGITHSISWAIKQRDYASTKMMDNGSETPIVVSTIGALNVLCTSSSSYPSDAAGIGMSSAVSVVDTYLYECGTLIAYTLNTTGRLRTVPIRGVQQAVSRAATI